MAKTPTAFDESLARAQADVAKSVFTQALGRMPSTISMGQLISDIAATPYQDAFFGMTLNGFIAAVQGQSAKSAESSGSGRNTRTQDGRDAIDADVALFLESAGTASAEAMRMSLGGTSAQLRDSLTRLMDAGMVTRSGEKRGTKYSWKSGKSGKKSK